MPRFIKEDSFKSKNKVYPFPDMDGTSEEDKQKPKYSLSFMQAVHSMYCTDKLSLGYGMASALTIFRAYSKGRQSIEKYKTFYSGRTKRNDSTVSDDIDGSGLTNKEYASKGWMNVLWDIVSFMPRLGNVIKGYFSDLDWDIKASNVDIDSGAEEEENMLKFWNESYFTRTLNLLRKQAQLPQKTLEYIPQSIAELEEMKAAGGFKAAYVREHEEILKHSEDISDWDMSLKDKLREDLKDGSCAFAYIYYDPETSEVRWGYVDAADAIMQYSRYDDFRDADYGGFYKMTTISELRKLGFKIKDLESVAKDASGLYGNPSEAEWNNFNKEISPGYYKWNDYRVRVMWLWWNDVSSKKKLKYTTTNNEARYYNYDKTIAYRREKRKEKYEKKYGTKIAYVDDKDDNYYFATREEVVETRTIKTYHSKWVVGTNMVYDYGLMPNQPGDGKLPIVGYKLSGKSLTQILIPIEDMFHMSWLKFQNGLSKAAEEGYAIDISALADISDGDNKKFDPLELVKMWRQEGIFLYKGTPNLAIGRGGSPVPITKIAGSLGENLVNAINIMDRCIKFVEDLTGLSPVSLGSTPGKDTQVGTQEMSLRSTHAALTPLKEGIRYIKQQLADRSSICWQLALRNDRRARINAEKVIGREGVKLLMAAQGNHVRYGIKMLARPTDLDKQEIMQSLNNAYQKHLQGLPGINDAQKILLQFELNNGGNIVAIAHKMGYLIRQDEERIAAEKREAIDRQGQWNQKLEDTRQNAMLKAEQMKSKRTEREYALKTRSETEIDRNKMDNEIRRQKIKANSEFLNELMLKDDEADKK